MSKMRFKKHKNSSSNNRKEKALDKFKVTIKAELTNGEYKLHLDCDPPLSEQILYNLFNSLAELYGSRESVKKIRKMRLEYIA